MSFAVPTTAPAQGVDCDALRSALQSSEPQGYGQDQYARAAQRQQVEIQRTQDYAASVGCGNPTDNSFDGMAPEQCNGIEARLRRMQDNLTQLQSRQQDLAQSSGRHAQILAQYNSYCARGNGDDTPTLHDVGPNDSPGRDPDDLTTVPVDPSQRPADGGILDDGQPARPKALGQAICVRSCDGGYFPLGRTATEGQLDNLEALCKASCPNTEAHLYSMPEDGKLASAVSASGASYTSLAAAFKFEKTFDATCTCKPPGQSWVQALADAEKLLDQHQGDVVVTEKMSAEMSRPTPAADLKAKDPPKKETPVKAAKERPRKSRSATRAQAPADFDGVSGDNGLRGSQAPNGYDFGGVRPPALADDP